MRKRVKPTPVPVIDAGGAVKVIDESGPVPRWKTVDTVFPASEVKAQEVMKRHGLTTAWLFDGTDKRLLIV